MGMYGGNGLPLAEAALIFETPPLNCATLCSRKSGNGDGVINGGIGWRGLGWRPYVGSMAAAMLSWAL